MVADTVPGVPDIGFGPGIVVDLAVILDSLEEAAGGVERHPGIPAVLGAGSASNLAEE